MTGMFGRDHDMRRHAVKFALLAVMAGLLGACEGITPVKRAPAALGPQEMDPNAAGVLSGDDGQIILFEKK
jgi:hypothetical protein